MLPKDFLVWHLPTCSIMHHSSCTVAPDLLAYTVDTQKN